MTSKTVGEFLPAARILVLVLYARWTKRVAFRRPFHRQLFKAFRCRLCFLGKFGALRRCCPVTATRNHNRATALRIHKAEVKCRKSTHRETDNMSLVNIERIKHSANVVTRALLRIALAVAGHIRGWIAARIKGHTAVIFRKVANLLFVRAVVAGKFVNKNNRDAFASFFVIELDSIVRRQMWHGVLVKNACPRADSPASMVTTEPLV